MQEIDGLISPVTFHFQKAFRILEIADISLRQYQGALPCDRDVVINLPGIGSKCASLALGISCGIPAVSVDVHVHRITRRWGLVIAGTPDGAAAELESKLNKRYWIELNSLLVPFGKHICTGSLPHCSKCPVLSMCRQIGVGRHR